MLVWLGAWAQQAGSVVLVGLVVGLGLAESIWPARPPERSTALRWCGNLGLHAINAVLPMVAPALLAPSLVRPLGLTWQPLAQLAGMAGDGGALLAGLLLIDLYAYALHRLSHAVFPLWRLHAVHHADAEMDVTTALRHHPLEALLSLGLGASVFAILGVPTWIASCYALLALVMSLAQHANLGVPGRGDVAIRTVLVTPGMHRVHHSADARDHDTNYGMVFSIWDHLFRTFRAMPATGPSTRFGVEQFAAPGYDAPYRLLLLPFSLRKAN